MFIHYAHSIPSFPEKIPTLTSIMQFLISPEGLKAFQELKEATIKTAIKSTDHSQALVVKTDAS